MKKFILIPLIVLFACSPVFADATQPLKGIRHYDIGIAPDFTLQDIDGESFALKDYRGRWVFLHFWASWCGPCRKEMPTIEKLIDKIDNEKLKIVMVNTAEDDDTIFTFLGSLGIEAISLMDKDGVITEKYKPRGLPTTFIIDPKGYLRYQAIGGREWDKKEYLDFIQQTINDKPQTKHTQKGTTWAKQTLPD